MIAATWQGMVFFTVTAVGTSNFTVLTSRVVLYTGDMHELSYGSTVNPGQRMAVLKEFMPGKYCDSILQVYAHKIFFTFLYCIYLDTFLFLLVAQFRWQCCEKHTSVIIRLSVQISSESIIILTKMSIIFHCSSRPKQSGISEEIIILFLNPLLLKFYNNVAVYTGISLCLLYSVDMTVS
jgi:hypothetical protein